MGVFLLSPGKWKGGAMYKAVDRGSGARTALTIGLSLLARHDEDDLPVLGELDPLYEAPAHAASIAEVLGGFGYRAGWRPDDAVEPGDEIRKAVTCADTEVLVVHIVAHGRLARTGDRDLHVVGSDGKDLDDPISAWIGLIESHPEKPRPRTLFVLDLCHSGAAATLPWHQEMPVVRRRAWVIAASGREEKAFDYRLSRATTAVLRQYLDGDLQVDSIYPYIPLSTVGHEIERAVTELNAAEGYPQQIEGSRVSFFAAREDDLPFFPNPFYRPLNSALTGVDSGISSLLDEAFDPRHFMLRGAGAEPLDRGVGQGYFHGREREIGTLTAWFNGQGPGFRIVTGKPGVGKSALLGVLVCAAHPKLRDATQNLWLRLPAKPACNYRLAVVHARRRDLEQITGSIVRQLGAAEQGSPTSKWDTHRLIEFTQTIPGAPHTLVIDALDEAERPEDIAQALLLPLARATEASRLRLLVGTRLEPRLASLIRLAEDTGGLINLDAAQPSDIFAALQRYVGDLLAVDTPYAAWDMADAATALAEGIAARLTGTNDPTWRSGSGSLGWGEFLVAGLYLRHVLTMPAQRDPAAARNLGLAVPLDLHELLELDLARRPDQPNLRPVLTALAHAEGRGMPERVLAHVTTAFTSPGPCDGPLPVGDVRSALGQARFYLRRDIDIDGTTLFRLFHEGLAERLRATPYDRTGQEETQ
ncbi:ATP-binding protein [Streptomyces sp. NPDC005017]|uniref:ATP-binding protein n=1 Tax=Streptomyces sp. NPDC005017 TaxID=3364706 RepID=UPI0036CD4B72